MKKLIGVITAVPLALAASAVAAPAPAIAAGAHCVTKAEYRKVHHGMKKRRVHRIFDTKGTQSYAYTIVGDHYQGRDYRTCSSKYGLVSVDYKNGRETDKFAFWG